ncbi:hypothetical protein HD806DRAFT_552207 [Xylariaceae sp. AK1471]|nr:hypothetical protein HD806DRAFT_552207 [Xylariaceae sp. AK1471]
MSTSLPPVACYQPVASVSSRIVTIFSNPANHTAIRARDGTRKDRLMLVELPELTRKHPGDPRPSLLQGVAFDPRLGRGAPARPEPLATVYRDTDLEWGMVVVDITDLKRVRYGIVGFAVGMAKFVPSLEAERRPFHYDARFHGEEGPLRVMDEVRPRKVLSAAEYMAKFNYDSVDYYNTSHHAKNMQILDSVQLVDSATLSLVLHECRDTHDATRAVGRLIRLAYSRHDGHLGQELLETLSANTISAALDDNLEAGGTITSLSLCIDSICSTPAELATSLCRATSLKEICLLQHPNRESDALSAQILATLATQTEVLSRVKVVFAGAYSAALRKKLWLQTSPDLMPRQIFPIQQIFARHQCGDGRLVRFEYNYIHLGDGLLKPERFAFGFLLWLSTLEPRSCQWFEEKAPSLAISSALASLTPDLLSTAQVTPILCENFALPVSMSDDTACSPRVRDLEAGGWTALVSQESNPGTRGTDVYHIRYAFVRVRGQHSIVLEDPPTSSVGPKKLEVIGLKEMLYITAPEVDPSIIDVCLDNTAKTITVLNSHDEPWVSGPDMLLEFLGNARTLNRKHRKAMEEDPESNFNFSSSPITYNS